VNTRYPSTPTAEPPFMVESRVPVAESRLTTHVFVPFLTAVITMALIAGCVMLWEWKPVAGVIGAVGLLAYGWRVLKADGGLTRLETITGLELDGKPGIGKPGPLTLLNPAEARRDVASQESPARPSDLPRMRLFVTRCVTEGTSESDQNIRPNTADRTNYVECRDGLLDLGLARWRNPHNVKAGWDLVLDRDATLVLIEKHVR
jgi:hypothetical protein